MPHACASVCPPWQLCVRQPGGHGYYNTHPGWPVALALTHHTRTLITQPSAYPYLHSYPHTYLAIHICIPHSIRSTPQTAQGYHAHTHPDFHQPA